MTNLQNKGRLKSAPSQKKKGVCKAKDKLMPTEIIQTEEWGRKE